MNDKTNFLIKLAVARLNAEKKDVVSADENRVVHNKRYFNAPLAFGLSNKGTAPLKWDNKQYYFRQPEMLAKIRRSEQTTEVEPEFSPSVSVGELYGTKSVYS